MLSSYISMKEYALYRLISYLSSPMFVAAAEVIAFAPFSKNIVGSLLIGFIFLTLSPTLIIYRKYKKGEVDIDISDKEDRPRIFIYSIISFGVCTALFWLVKDKIMFTVALSYFLVTTVIMLVNFFSKISTHTAGLAGPITAIVFYFGIYYSGLYLLLLPVAYSRFKLGKHNRFQLFSGAIIASVLTYLIFTVVF